METHTRMLDIVQRKIVASEQSIIVEADMIVLRQPHLTRIQQSLEVVMQPSDVSDKLIVLLESIEVNSFIKRQRRWWKIKRS
jgi:hypothetical protein